MIAGLDISNWIAALLTAISTAFVGHLLRESRDKWKHRRALRLALRKDLARLIAYPNLAIGGLRDDVRDRLHELEATAPFPGGLRKAVARCESAAKRTQQDAIGQPFLVNEEEMLAALQALQKVIG